VNSLIIVESKNDQYFVEKLKESLSFKTDVEPICSDIDFECLSGGVNLRLKRIFGISIMTH